MIKNVLITGGCGFIGSNLAKRLIGQEMNVTILDNMSEQIHGENHESEMVSVANGNVKLIIGDVRNRKDWINTLEGQDAVIHYAAETGTGQSMYEIEKYNSVNVMGTAIMLDILANERHSVKKIIVASSRAIYGEGSYICLEHGLVFPKGRNAKDMLGKQFECLCPICGKIVSVCPTSEDAAIHCNSIYAVTKKTQEDLCMVAGRTLGIPTVALRYQNVYGPGQSLKNPYTGILSIFSTRIMNGNDINIFEDGMESRDLYIDDVVDATVQCLLSSKADNNVFNVGSGEATSVIDIAKMLVAEFKSSSQVSISGNFREGDIRHCFADLTKIKECIGFVPQYGIERGLKKFCEWVSNHPIEQDNYERSIAEMKQRGLYK